MFSKRIFADMERGTPETMRKPAKIERVLRRIRALSRGESPRTTTCEAPGERGEAREGRFTSPRCFLVLESVETSSPEIPEAGERGEG